ncbi:MAG: Nramp family divalent metal transporter [Pirellulales bacterium]
MNDARTPVDPYALSPLTVQSPPRSLWAAALQIGPGLILAGNIVGSGELILTTSLGAEFGFAFLWLILFSCIIKVFVQIELGRYAISSGKPTLTALNELPGPRLGAHWLVWWWFFMLLATVFQLGGMVGGVGQALHLAFPQVVGGLSGALGSAAPRVSQHLADHPEELWAVLTTLLCIGLLLRGGYKRIERLTTALVVSVTLVTMLCVAMLPGAGYPIRATDLREGFSLAVFALPGAAIAAAFSTFGVTGVGATELYAYPYWCLEKGYARFTGPNSPDPSWVDRARGWLRVMHLDAWLSMLVFTAATLSFYFLGATVLHRQGLLPERSQMIATLSEMYVPAFGEWTKVFFLIGVWAVLFKTLYVSSAANSRLTADFLGLAGAVHLGPGVRERWVTRLCIFYPALALTLYLGVKNPKLMVVIGGFAQAATLPIISGAAIYLRYRRMDPRLRPSLFSDLCLWFAFLTIAAVSLYAIPRSVHTELWPTLRGFFSGS